MLLKPTQLRLKYINHAKDKEEKEKADLEAEFEIKYLNSRTDKLA